MITKITCEYIDDDNKNKKTLTKDLATDAMTIFHSDYNYYRFNDMYNKTNPENFTDIKKNIISATRNKLPDKYITAMLKKYLYDYSQITKRINKLDH